MANISKTDELDAESLPIRLDASGRKSGNTRSSLPLQESGLEKSGKSKKKKKKGIGKKILPLFIILLIIASLIGVLVYNVFDIREKYLRSTIDKIPIISGLLLAPGAEDEYKDYNRDDLIAMITELENKLNDEAASSEEKDRRIETYMQEISNLKVFEDQQIEFLEEKAEFERMIAEGDPLAYAEFYESIWPESAAELYENALGSVLSSTEWKKYISKIAAMDERSAARMLEELIPTDMPIVVDILRNLKNEQAAAILSEMDTQMAAAVVKQLYPL